MKIKLILIAILLGLLAACGTVGLEPSNQLVEKAIALQLSQTQQQLNQQLQISPQPPRFEITRLEIANTESLVIENLPSYHLQGTYNQILQLPNRRVAQQQNPFDIYIQRQKEGKTWRLALPQFYPKDGKLDWFTYLIE